MVTYNKGLSLSRFGQKQEKIFLCKNFNKKKSLGHSQCSLIGGLNEKYELRKVKNDTG